MLDVEWVAHFFRSFEVIDVLLEVVDLIHFAVFHTEIDVASFFRRYYLFVRLAFVQSLLLLVADLQLFLPGAEILLEVLLFGGNRLAGK